MKAYAIVKKKSPKKISTLEIYSSKKDIRLNPGEKWIEITIKPK